jgi:hypothetical protein
MFSKIEMPELDITMGLNLGGLERSARPEDKYCSKIPQYSASRQKRAP